MAAHSTTRALYAAYNGPLYQVLRQSDGKTLDIGVVQPCARPDAGGYANAAAQDAFCANTYCWITTIYDQSGKHNDLTQAPRGGFSGPAMGGFNNLPVADMAPITIMGHKAYGVFIEPGMGLREDDAKGTAVDDQAEGQYWVINGQHYNSGCCFDYGNAEIDSRDDGNGTMETTYYGNATAWYHGNPPGPWIMTDQENNLVGCVNPDGSKLCASLPNITWRFVTAMAKGEPHHWTSMGGDAQQGALSVMFDGPRVNSTYDPMRKQGAILLGNGGDNSNGSQGTFYEGAMTAAGTFPTDATDQLVQANVVAAKYDVPRLSLAPASATATPPGLQTFSPGSSQDTTVTFTNTTGAPAADVKLSISVPTGSGPPSSPGATETSETFAGPVAPGASVSATFKVTSGPAAFNGDLVGNASWTNPQRRNAIRDHGREGAERQPGQDQRVPHQRRSSRQPDELVHRALQRRRQRRRYLQLDSDRAPDPAGHLLDGEDPGRDEARGARLLPARPLQLRAGGPRARGRHHHPRQEHGRHEGRRYDRHRHRRRRGDPQDRKHRNGGRHQHNAVATPPRGSGDHHPRSSTARPACRSASGAGRLRRSARRSPLATAPPTPPSQETMEQYEVVTVTAVGKPGTQAYLGADAPAGSTNIKVTSVANISAGDKIRLDIDSVGHGIETVTVTKVGTQSSRSTLAADASAGATNIKVRDANGFAVGDKMTVGTPATRNGHVTAVGARAGGASVDFTPALAQAHHRRGGDRSGHGPRPGRPAQVQPCGQPPLQRSGNGDQLPAGDGLCPLEQRARPGARHRHHARPAPWPRNTRSTRLCVTPRSRPRATRGRRRPTSGSAAPPSPQRRQHGAA